ncbi:HAD-IA family hydrolase [Streptomyces longisporus]|uniref:HAD family hydrolase n=1 Tax=Streptomyces longisporus TaxID=1948 RepID=A0ABP5YGZ2_STRLO
MAFERDDIVGARELLKSAAPAEGPSGRRCVLFDFDGPICRLFPDDSSMRVADELRKTIAAARLTHVLTAYERTHKDPHVVLRAVHRAGRERHLENITGLVRTLEAQVTKGELEAVPDALPTEHADELIRRLTERGFSLAVVTNNSPLAADRYLRSRKLEDCFDTVQGRTADPDLMKPDPDVLHRALKILGVAPKDAVMVGDTPTDFQAAVRAGGIAFIGYGRNEEKRARLRDAQAKPVIGSYAPLLEEARESGAGESANRFTGEAARR